MAYFLFQTVLISTIAIVAGSGLGWWLHRYYSREQTETSDRDLEMVKSYLAESIKENARLKLQLKQTEEKVEVLVNEEVPQVQGVDFEAYQAFENTVKEANLRKYLN
jgi:regulator of replication initiation timing